MSIAGVHSVENNGISNFNYFFYFFFIFKRISVFIYCFFTVWCMEIMSPCGLIICMYFGYALSNTALFLLFGYWMAMHFGPWLSGFKIRRGKHNHKSTAGSIIKTPHSLGQFLGCHQAWHSWDRFSNNFDTLSYVYLLTDRQYSFDQAEVKLLLLPPVF